MTTDTPTPKNSAGIPTSDTGTASATPASGEPAATEPTAAPTASADASGAPPDPTTAPAQDEDYQVGYGKPPKKNQFKKGQPSPRKGKKKSKLKKLADIQYMVAMEEIPVRKNGKTVMMSRYEASVRQKSDLALSGDRKAMNEFIEQTSGRIAWEYSFEYRAEMKIAQDAAREKAIKMVKDDDPEEFERIQNIIMEKMADIERDREEGDKPEDPPEDSPKSWSP